MKTAIFFMILLMGCTSVHSSSKSDEVLKVQKVAPTSDDMNAISALMDKQPKHKIEKINWPNLIPSAPKVEFAIAHDNQTIYIKYYVVEECTMAMTTQDNGPVYTDSCVEFFVSPDDGDSYYNFEFACNGTALLEHQVGGNPSEGNPLEILKTVRRLPSLGRGVIPEFFGENKWSMTLAIPVSALYNHKIRSLSGKTFTANFYKYGSKLTIPNCVSWRPIVNDKPNFHLPQFFGKVKFE